MRAALVTTLTALLALAWWQLRAEAVDERAHTARLRVLDRARRNGGI
jgi:hypothetical protein